MYKIYETKIRMFICERCGYATDKISNYDRHIKRKNKCNVIMTHPGGGNISKQVEEELDNIKNRLNDLMLYSGRGGMPCHGELNEFGSEDRTHVSREFIRECIFHYAKGFLLLFEEIHYKNDRNLNIRFHSVKHKQVCIVKDSAWTIYCEKQAYSEIIDRCKEMMLQCLNDVTHPINDIDVYTFLMQSDKNNIDNRNIRRMLRASLMSKRYK